MRPCSGSTPPPGDHGVLASGVRNSFDGVWVDGMGYLFSDNGGIGRGTIPLRR